MEFAAWLTAWLKRHPLKTPDGHDRLRYTAQVMSRVKELAPSSATVPAIDPARQGGVNWWARLRLAPVLAAATAGLVIALHLRAMSEQRFVEGLTRDVQMLAAVDESIPELVTAGDPVALADDLELHDLMVLAESQPTDEQWVDQTVQLLDKLNEELPENQGNTASSDQDWLDELQLLDNNDLAASS